MKKYKAQQVFDYLMANDLNNVEELENDPKFMFRIIEHTKDKRMYEYCERDAKLDLNLVKLLINMFNDDTDFILKISDFLLKNSSNVNDVIELRIILGEFYNKNYDNNFLKFEILNGLMIKKIEDDRIKSKYYNKPYEFALYETMFEGRKVILDYVAKYIIRIILYNNYIKFEPYIHSLVLSKEDITSQGIDTFLLKIISTYDEDLTNYCCLNKTLLKEFEKELLIVIKNWEKFEIRNGSEKNDLFEYYYNKYLLENESYCSIYVYSLKNYIIKKYHLENYMSFDNRLVEFKVENLADKKACNYVCNLAKKIFIDNDLNFNDYNLKKKKTKILEFKSN